MNELLTEVFILGFLTGGCFAIVMELFARRLGRCAAERTIRQWEKESLERITTGSENTYFGEPGLRVPSRYEGLVYPKAKKKKP